MSQHPPTSASPPAPDPLAVAMSKLEPAPHGFEWNALMFAAGRASKARTIVTWQVAAAVCALVAIAFACAYFARPPAVVERERVIYVDRVVEKPVDVQPAPLPLPLPKPEVKPEVKPEPKPQSPSPVSPQATTSTSWVFEPSPERGAGARWLNLRNEVLTVGLSVLPDHGQKMPPPEK